MRPATLVISSPCQASWAAMTPTAAGRHCAACQQTVIDFTHQTDAEILAALRRAAGPTCGRLRADQLGRPLLAPGPAPRWRTWLGAALAVGSVLSVTKAAAQASSFSSTGAPGPAASSVAHQPGSAVAPTPAPQLPGGPMVLRGTIRDAARYEGLPGATVLLKGTTIGTYTDADGAFELLVPSSSAAIQLVFSSVGYVTQEASILPGHGQPLAVVLAADTRMMGEVIVTSYKNPWPWRPRLFFNWGKYWATRPFRS